jgi:hypothetical protein
MQLILVELPLMEIVTNIKIMEELVKSLNVIIGLLETT